MSRVSTPKAFDRHSFSTSKTRWVSSLGLSIAEEETGFHGNHINYGHMNKKSRAMVNRRMSMPWRISNEVHPEVHLQMNKSKPLIDRRMSTPLRIPSLGHLEMVTKLVSLIICSSFFFSLKL